MKKFSIFFILLCVYYFVIPVSFLFNNFLSLNKNFINEVFYINYFFYVLADYIKYNFFSIILLIIIFYSLYKIFFLNEKKVQIKIHYLTYNFIIIICIIFLLKDIFFLLKNYFENEHLNRTLIFYEFLNVRKTHVNILIILSVINFKDNKTLSYSSYFFIFVYSILSLSRIDLLILFVCHFMTNVCINKKNIHKIILISTLIIFFIIYYRFAITKNDFIVIFAEPLHLMISSIIFFENLLSLSFYDYFFQNIHFLLKDFFYFPMHVNNYFISSFPQIPIYSIRGIDSLICFPIVFITYFFILKLLINNFFINKFFLNCIFVYLLISLFRGNFVHNLNFAIKLYLLIIILSWFIQKMQQLRSKVA